MSGTLTVTVLDGLRQGQVDALVRVYDTLGTLHGDERTDSDGIAIFAGLDDGDYRVHADPISHLYLPQWYGGGDAATAPTVTINGDAPNLELVLTLPDPVTAAASRVQPLFWYDTTADEALLLYPGEEKRFRDRQDDLYQHVLVGPFLNRADAVAAGS